MQYVRVIVYVLNLHSCSIQTFTPFFLSVDIIYDLFTHHLLSAKTPGKRKSNWGDEEEQGEEDDDGKDPEPDDEDEEDEEEYEGDSPGDCD